MHRNIIHYRTYAIFMQGIDQEFQIIRGSISSRRTEKSSILVAPGLITRMLRKRHELHIVVSLLLQIFHQHRSNLPVCIPTLRYPICINDLLWSKPLSIFIIHRFTVPRSHVHLIHIEWSSLALISRSHPSGIAKSILFHVSYYRSKCRSQFHAKAIRITVINAIAIPLVDLIFVHLTGLCPRNKTFEEAAVVASLHGGLAPRIKLSCNRYRLRIRCIRHKVHTRHHFSSALAHILLHNMSSQLIVSIKTFS